MLKTSLLPAHTTLVQQIFRDHYIFLVPSLLFSFRLATLSLLRVREHGGDGIVVKPAEAGFLSIKRDLELRAQQASCTIVVADTPLLTKYAHLCNLTCRPTQWLTES